MQACDFHAPGANEPLMVDALEQYFYSPVTNCRIFEGLI